MENGEFFLEVIILNEDEAVDVLFEPFIGRRICLGVKRTNGFIFSEEEEQ